MAVRRPLIAPITPGQPSPELPSGDTLPVSMQDTYDYTTTSGGNKTLVLDATVPVNYKKTVPGSGVQFTHRWVDASDVYLGGLYYSSSAQGLCADFGENVSAAYVGTSSYPIHQGVRSRGVPGARTAVLSGDILVAFRGIGYNGSSSQFTSEMRFVASQDHSGGIGGTRWELWTTANGTSPAAKYNALTVEHNGEIVAKSATAGDFKARGAYKCPFFLYSLPSPYGLSGTATETKISSNITVPANTLGANSKLKTDALTSCTTTANAKYLIVRFGPNADNTDPIMLYFNFGGQISQHIFDTLSCLNSASTKVGFLSYTSGAIGTSSVSKSVAMQQISVDNTVVNYITVWMKNGQTTDASTLEMLTIEVIP